LITGFGGNLRGEKKFGETALFQTQSKKGMTLHCARKMGKQWDGEPIQTAGKKKKKMGEGNKMEPPEYRPLYGKRN